MTKSHNTWQKKGNDKVFHVSDRKQSSPRHELLSQEIHCDPQLTTIKISRMVGTSGAHWWINYIPAYFDNLDAISIYWICCDEEYLQYLSYVEGCRKTIRNLTIGQWMTIPLVTWNFQDEFTLWVPNDLPFYEHHDVTLYGYTFYGCRSYCFPALYLSWFPNGALGWTAHCLISFGYLLYLLARN